MATLQEYLNSKYPSKKRKKKVKEIIVSILTKEETQELDGGELDLSAYPSLEKVKIDSWHLKSGLTSLKVSN